MTIPVRNRGDGLSFFQRQQTNPSKATLVSSQLSPSQPQINDLTTISNPVVPIDNVADMVTNFDPDLYDLRPTSHLMRLIAAVCGAPGVGGLRKQYLTTRLSSMITGANFVDLDTFYGAIFNLQRHIVERMPRNVDGTTVNPLTDIATSDVWDDVASRDARYRSRIHLLARAINMGATYSGLKGAAEAVLGCEVDLTESWVSTDESNFRTGLTIPTSLTYGQIKAQNVTFGNTRKAYNVIEGRSYGGQTLPAGNRGELVFTARQNLDSESRYQLTQVLQTLCPSNTQVTLAPYQTVVEVPVAARGFASDSENWTIQTQVTPPPTLIQPVTNPVYKNIGPISEARPVMSQYTGENWTYNANVVRTAAYQMVNNLTSNSQNTESVQFNDGTTVAYKAEQAIMDVRQAISQRLSSQGIVTNSPYASNR